MYGNKVQFQRSYHGTMAVTKRVTGAKEVNAEVIFEGDDVNYKTKNGKIVDLEHSQSFANRDTKKLLVHMQQLYSMMKAKIIQK